VEDEGGRRSLCRGRKQQDDNGPVWSGKSCGDIEYGKTLYIWFYDEDMSGDQSLGRCSIRVGSETEERCVLNNGTAKVDIRENPSPFTGVMRVKVDVDSTKVSGREWDLDGSCADPYLSIQLAESGISDKTDNVLDSCSTWFDLSVRSLGVGETVTIWIYDEDFDAPDPIGNFEFVYDGKRTPVNRRVDAARVAVEFRK